MVCMVRSCRYLLCVQMLAALKQLEAAAKTQLSYLLTVSLSCLCGNPESQTTWSKRIIDFNLEETGSRSKSDRMMTFESQVVWGNDGQRGRTGTLAVAQCYFHASQYIRVFLQMKIFDKNKDGCLDLNDLARYFLKSRAMHGFAVSLAIWSNFCRKMSSPVVNF